MGSYIPTRLIDPTILNQLFIKNPVLDKVNSRLIAYDLPIKADISNTLKINKIDKKINSVKDDIIYEMNPSLLNGIIFISICLLIYFILYYKYTKKKNLINK